MKNKEKEEMKKGFVCFFFKLGKSKDFSKEEKRKPGEFKGRLNKEKKKKIFRNKFFCFKEISRLKKRKEKKKKKRKII
jgi:hypothetical protein